MNVWTLLQILGRQRAAVGSVLALTVVATTLVLWRLEPSYQGSASITFVLSGESSDAADPRVLDSSSPQLTANVLAELVAGDTVRQRLQAAGATAAYQATVDETGPLIRITASGAQEAEVVGTVEAVMNEISRELQERQDAAGTPSGLRQTAEVLASPLDARSSPDQPGVVSATGSVLIVGPSGPGVDPAPANPLAQLGRSIPLVVAEITTSATFQERLEAMGAEDEFEIFPDGQASILRILATSEDPEGAHRTVEGVIAGINEELAQRQVNTPISGRVMTETLSSPRAEQLPISWLRPTLVTIGIGLGSAVSLAVLLEGLQAMRQSAPAPNGIVREPAKPARSRLGRRAKGVMVPPEDDDWHVEGSASSR